MAFIDSKNQTAGSNTAETSRPDNTKPAVELAVFNLASVTHTEDHKFIAHQIQKYLQACGNTSLEQIKASANVPTVANIFALSGSVLDLILFATEPKQAEAGVQQSALLSMNLIGLFLQPNNEAHVRMALRPMLGLMAECLYPANGKIKEADLRRMQLHLNAQMAGDLEKFLQETQAKLTGLLSSATTMGASILKAFTSSVTGGLPSIASAGASAEKRDPNLQFSNWAQPLIDLLGTPAQADMTAKISAANLTLQTEVQKATPLLATAIQQHSNVATRYSLAWLIQETLSVIQTQGKKATASVPLNQTGEHEQHINGDILEFVTLQPDALNDPICATQPADSMPSDSATKHSISYAIGAERVNHADFYLPKVGFAFSRQYNSQMNEFDYSMIGARWMMPFSNVIIHNEKGYLFIDSNGRKHQLPASIVYESYQVPFEGFSVAPHEQGDLLLNFGSDWNFHFHSFNAGKHYHLVQQFNEQTDEKVVLTYLLYEQFAYLQAIDFQLKRGKHLLKFAFNEQAKVIAAFVDEQAEPLARYEYDAQGNLIKATDQNGHMRSYEYNQAHQLTRYTDRTGRGQNIRYESTSPKAKAIAEWADDGSFKTRLEWHPRLRQVAVYDAYDVPTHYYFDLDGFTYRTRLADGREKWISRDRQKRITRQIDFAGLETEQVYNDQDQLVKIVQPNGGIILFAYDEEGNLSETKDPEGNIWKKEYDADGNVSKDINPLGQTTQYKYNNDNQLVEVIDAKGGSKKIQYNDLGQMVSYTDCSGKSSAWEYDEDGTLTAQAAADAQQVQYLYSTHGKDKGQLQAIIYPDGLKEQFEHDEEGRLLKHTDSKGLTTQYQYNPVGLLEQRIDANRHQIGYQWDKQGRIQKLINQNHAEYLFDYNRYGQLIREQAFDGEEKYFSYHDNGQLFQIHQPNILTQFGYHPDGAIASKTYTHLQTRHSQVEEFEYNLNNQLSKATNAESQIDFYRNPLGQLVREHQHYKVPNLPALSAVLRYEYDELGNLTQTIRPDGQVQANLSYGSGHIYGIAFNQQDMVAFQRDDLHRETTRLLANGLVQNKNYNDVGLLSSQIIRHEQETLDQLQQAKHQAERHYHYDNNYLLTQVDDSRLGKLNYQYDAIGRLIKAQNPYSSESFSFDPAGNLIDPIATQTSQVKNNLITQYQGKHYKYDAQGNVIETTQSGQTLKLTWDNLNRLIQSDHNGQITNYGYDVFGRRLFKKNTTEDSLTLFGWDGDLMIWESYKTNSNQLNKQDYTKHYVYEPDSFVPLLQTGYTRFIQLIETPDYRQFQDIPYSIYKDPVWKTETRKNKAELERVAFYHCDQVGTPQTLSNELGECIWEIKQDTWGTTQEIKTANESNPLEQSNLRFQGQYYDKETGLHYNRYRYYEPYSARYVSKDPIGLFGGLHSTKYVSDPNQWIDPMGLMAGNNKRDPFQNTEGVSPSTLYINKIIQKDRDQRREHFREIEARETASRKESERLAQKEAELKRKEKRREYSGQMGINQMNVPGKPITPQKTLNQMAKENIKTSGTIGTFSTKAIGGFSGAVGLANSETLDGKVKKCGLVFVCPSFGAVVQVTGSVQKMVSTSELNSGISASSCVNGSGSAVVGATGSVCTTMYDSSGMDLKNGKTGIKTFNDYKNVDNYTGSVGPAVGVALGSDVSFCPQITICSTPK
ncbi:RHS repeat-associated core domain-containing protein [Acinetobacter sp.]|jgi:RHS repeat-associated protein|uniref:RHS repeat-associated core domain-containing protein n=3 Tax=Acinetobacter TaxID=469 RepID=UPI00282F16B9|nr:RHS repeat-associated core domain-containing protein [Acinetobacter sp.]MDR0235377.1 RHS domain-containing protein [Acinetobacter sp.]